MPIPSTKARVCRARQARVQRWERRARSSSTGFSRQPGCSAATPRRRRTRGGPARAGSASGDSSGRLRPVKAMRPPPENPPQQCQCAAERDQETAEPDQGDERLPPKAKLPAALVARFAEHGVELTIPAGFDRRLVGRCRRIGKIAALWPEDRYARSTRSAELGFERGPIWPGQRKHLTELDQPWSNCDPIPRARRSQFFLRECAV